MADNRRAKRQAHPDVTPAFSYTPRRSNRSPAFAIPCHSDRSPDIVGTKRRNLFQHLPSFPASPYLPIYHTITASIMQNKPNFQKPETTATSYARRIYRNIPPPHARKKQTQSNPIHHAEARHSATLHEIRFTLHASRLPRGGDTISDIRSTNPVSCRDSELSIAYNRLEW